MYRHIGSIATGLAFFYLLVLFTGALAKSGARSQIPSLLSLTRSAAVIVKGEIQEIRNQQAALKIEEVFKGDAVPSSISLTLPIDDDTEHPASHYQAGEEVLLFASRKDHSIEPLFGNQGLISAAQLQSRSQSLSDYQRAIRAVVQYDAVNSATAKVNMLTSMLKDNPVIEQVATEIIYLEIRPNSYPVAELIDPLTTLAKENHNRLAVPATQALGKIADKKVIPVFIRLLDSENPYVRETAFHILKNKTGSDLRFDIDGTKEQRSEQINQWLEWWKLNADKTTLRP